MILKSFEINKVNLKIHKFLLFYGKNDGYKNEEINKIKEKLIIKGIDINFKNNQWNARLK